LAVSTLIFSPVVTNGGTCTVIPVSSLAGLKDVVAVECLMARLGVDHGEHHGRRQLHADGAVVVEVDSGRRC